MRLGKNAKVELLRGVPLFANCSKRELEQVAAIADEVSVAEGTRLITEGDRGREFFALIDGSADVRRKGRKIRSLERGDFFGEIALVAELPRTATVTTTAPSRVLVVVDREFDRLLEAAPSLALKVLRALAARLAPMTV